MSHPVSQPIRTLAVPALGALLFAAVIPYAVADARVEAFFLTGVFLILALTGTVFGKVTLPLAALGIYSLLQGLATLLQIDASPSNIVPYSYDLTSGLRNGLKFLAAALLLGLLIDLCARRLRDVLLVLLVIGNFHALLGLARFLAQDHFPAIFPRFILPQLVPGVGFGTYLNQNHYALLMVMTLGIDLGLCLRGALAARWRVALLVLALAAWAAIVMTASRGGIISSVAVAAAVVLLPAGSQPGFPLRRKLVAAGATVVIGAALVLIGQDRVIHRFEDIPGQVSGETATGTFRRLDAWEASLKMIADNPVYGTGFGGYRFAVSQYIDIAGGRVPEAAHNDWLEFVTSSGMVGAALGLWFLFWFGRAVIQNFREPQDGFRSAARIGALGALAGVAVHSAFDFGLQVFANTLFFLAVAAVASHPSGALPRRTGFALSPLLMVLAAAPLVYGYSNFSVRHAAAGFTDVIHFPFDAEYLELRSIVRARAGGTSGAAEDLRRAVRFRPRDYKLRLKLALTLRDRPEEAEIEFREAVRLAPFYAGPRFYLGSFLIGQGRLDEGIDALRTAMRRSPIFAEEASEIIWRESGADARKFVRLMGPSGGEERERVAAFLLNKKDYSAILGLVCEDRSSEFPRREGLAARLFEKNRFRLAFQVEKEDCTGTERFQSELDDGSFESGELRRGSGFGWRIPKLPASVGMGFDEETAGDGRQSLRVEFRGLLDPTLPLLSQVVPVRPNSSYRVSFLYRTEGLSGEPVVHIILRRTATQDSVRKMFMPAATNGWHEVSYEIATDGDTQAIEFRLAGPACPDASCPVRGRLWLDRITFR